MIRGGRRCHPRCVSAPTTYFEVIEPGRVRVRKCLAQSVTLLLLLHARILPAGGRTDTKGVLAVGEANASTLDQAAERVTRQLVEGSRRIVDILKLHEAHRSIALLPEAELPISGSLRE